VGGGPPRLPLAAVPAGARALAAADRCAGGLQPQASAYALLDSRQPARSTLIAKFMVLTALSMNQHSAQPGAHTPAACGICAGSDTPAMSDGSATPRPCIDHRMLKGLLAVTAANCQHLRYDVDCLRSGSHTWPLRCACMRPSSAAACWSPRIAARSPAMWPLAAASAGCGSPADTAGKAGCCIGFAVLRIAEWHLSKCVQTRWSCTDWGVERSACDALQQLTAVRRRWPALTAGWAGTPSCPAGLDCPGSGPEAPAQGAYMID
jgi:hypothetical protein